MDTYAQYLVRQLRLATSWEEVRDVLIQVIQELPDVDLWIQNDSEKDNGD